MLGQRGATKRDEALPSVHSEIRTKTHNTFLGSSACSPKNQTTVPGPPLQGDYGDQAESGRHTDDPELHAQALLGISTLHCTIRGACNARFAGKRQNARLLGL
jgi:hypothetical protein